MFENHPEQCLVGESRVILDGREHTEYQANQHRKEPGEHCSDDNNDENELETDDYDGMLFLYYFVAYFLCVEIF